MYYLLVLRWGLYYIRAQSQGGIDNKGAAILHQGSYCVYVQRQGHHIEGGKSGYEPLLIMRPAKTIRRNSNTSTIQPQ